MTLDDTLRKGFRLGDWIVRPIEGVVVGAKESRHLQPKTMDVLVCLAAQPGQVITRDEIIERVWSGSAVSDEPLTRCIHEIRRALGDHHDEPDYIKTIPKRGYQLLAEVSELTVTDLIVDAPVRRQPGLFWQVTRQRVLWVGAVYSVLAWLFVQIVRFAEQHASADLVPPDWLMPALVIIVLLGFPVAIFYAWVRQVRFDVNGEQRDGASDFPGVAPLLWSRRGIDIVLVTLVISILAGFAVGMVPLSAADPVVSQARRIAVVPFEGHYAVGQGNWLGKGLAEDLRNRLLNYDSLEVSSRNHSFRDSLRGMDAQQLGRELNVQFLLEGAVARGANQLSVNARLIDAVTGMQLWSGSFHRSTDELLTIQEEIVLAVADAFSLQHSSFAGEGDEWPTSLNIAAYDSYLRGRDQLRDADNVEAIGLAAAWFDQAIAIDQHLAVARVGLCEAYVRELSIGESDWAYGRANQACAELMLHSPDMLAAHIALADFYRVTGHADNAVKEYNWVASRRPNNADAWLGLAKAHWQEGEYTQADEAFTELLRLQPDAVDSRERYGHFLISQRRYPEALDVARELLRLDSERIAGYEQLATGLFMTGEFEAAIQASRQVLSRDLDRQDAIIMIAQSYHYLGRHARARDIYRQAAKMMPRDHVAAGGLAIAYAQLDETNAVEQAQQSFMRARKLAEEALASNADEPLTLISLAYYCAALSDIECAQRNQQRALALAPDDLDVQYRSALVYAELGESQEAAASTERALALGYPQVLLLTDPLLENVWSQRRFATARISQLLSLDY